MRLLKRFAIFGMLVAAILALATIAKISSQKPDGRSLVPRNPALYYGPTAEDTVRKLQAIPDGAPVDDSVESLDPTSAS